MVSVRTFRPVRPRWLLLIIGLLFLAKVIQAVGVLTNAAQLATLPLPVPAIVSLTFSGSWAITLAYLGIDLMRRRRWAFTWIGPLLTAYVLAELTWQVSLFRSDYDRGRLLFQVVISLMALLPIWWVVWRHGWLSIPRKNS